MALVAFLRGVNVGGHRTFRPSELAHELRAYEVVNVGAAGTFIIRKPGSRAAFQAALRRKLPFETQIALCAARDVIRLEKLDPFAGEPLPPASVRFVSIFAKTCRPAALPVQLPGEGEWFVRMIGADRRFAFGIYRRHMKTIGYLGKIDSLFGVPTTIRNWNTIREVVRILREKQRS